MAEFEYSVTNRSQFYKTTGAISFHLGHTVYHEIMTTEIERSDHNASNESSAEIENLMITTVSEHLALSNHNMQQRTEDFTRDVAGYDVLRDGDYAVYRRYPRGLEANR